MVYFDYVLEQLLTHQLLILFQCYKSDFASNANKKNMYIYFF